jgi:hypothetical protein
VSGTTASERLQAKLGLAFPAVTAASERVWESPLLRELYPVWLVTMHGVVRSAVPLMEAALERSRVLAAGGDEVAAGLAPYLEHHAPEEAGHDAWLLEDLAELGHDPEEARLRLPSPRVAELVGAQYYWLRHVHPVTLLGHMSFVEGHPPQPGFAARLQEATGYPREAFRAVRRHERLDIRHREELFETIDALPLDPRHEALIGMSALHTMNGAIAVFEEIAAAVPASVGART